MKSNFQRHNGLDAITGKANFDISQWMLIRLLEAISGPQGTLAMLCKSSVARKTLRHAWQNAIMLERPAVYGVDADRHFDAAVDAVLLVAHFRPGASDFEAKVYATLRDTAAQSAIGYEDGTLLSDIPAYHLWKHLCGEEAATWRSGIKHDCTKVMELAAKAESTATAWANWSRLKTFACSPCGRVPGWPATAATAAALHDRDPKEGWRGHRHASRDGADDVGLLEDAAPVLKKRGSSIYRNRPPFSVFGVGDYSFAPWKVAISGFYKKLEFVVLGPVKGRPVVLDDTSYFLPCQTKEQAEYLTTLLNSPAARSFYKALIFWDSKRPITADLLRRLDLRKLAVELGSEEEFDAYYGKPGDDPSPAEKSVQLGLWA